MADGILQAGVFLRDHLRKVEPQILRTVYPELWGYEGKYHTAKPGLSFGIREIYQSRIDFSGTAVNYGGKATNIPLANLGMVSDKYRTLTGVLAAEWNWQELQTQETAQASGFPTVNVVEEYRAALERGLREWVHIKTVFGDPSIGFQGMFTGADVTITDVVSDINTFTARQLNDFFRGIIRNFKKVSRLTAQPTNLLVSIDLDYALSTPFQDAGAFQDARSPKEYLLKNGINAIDVVNEASNQFLAQYGVTAASTTKDMFILYEASEQTLDKMYSTVYTTPVAIKDDQLTYRQTGLVAVSEMRYKAPYRVNYYTYPKA